MPQLGSGRHVALSASLHLGALAAERDQSKYFFAIVALRLHAGTSEARLSDSAINGGAELARNFTQRQNGGGSKSTFGSGEPDM